MSETLKATVQRIVDDSPPINFIYEVELTLDARALVSSSLRYVEVYDQSAAKITVTPERARQVAHAVLDALDTINIAEEVTR